MDKEKKWFVHERNTRHAVQDLCVFLTNKSKAGAIYQVKAPQEESTTKLRKRMRQDSPSPIPNLQSKRQQPDPSSNYQSYFSQTPAEVPTTADSPAISDPLGLVRQGPSQPRNYVPLELPPDFLAAPGFNFVPPILGQTSVQGDDVQMLESTAQSWTFPTQEVPMATEKDFQTLLAAFSQSQQGSQGPSKVGSPERPQVLKHFFSTEWSTW